MITTRTQYEEERADHCIASNATTVINEMLELADDDHRAAVVCLFADYLTQGIPFQRAVDQALNGWAS